jgi:hypothetical protein
MRVDLVFMGFAGLAEKVVERVFWDFAWLGKFRIYNGFFKKYCWLLPPWLECPNRKSILVFNRVVTAFSTLFFLHLFLYTGVQCKNNEYHMGSEINGLHRKFNFNLYKISQSIEIEESKMYEILWC